MKPRATERLIADLKALPQSPQRDLVIRRATRWCYHDFRSTHATPKSLLYQDLVGCDGAEEMRDRVMMGGYDESREEAEEWFRSAECQAAMAQ